MPFQWPLSSFSLPTEPVWLTPPSADTTRRFTPGWSEGEPVLIASDGRIQRGFPRARKTDDAALSAAARRDWDNTVHRFESLEKAQKKALKESFIQGDLITLDELA